MAANDALSLEQLQRDTARALTSLADPPLAASAFGVSGSLASPQNVLQGSDASQAGSAPTPTAPGAGGTTLASALSEATAAVTQLAQNTLAQIEQLQNLNESMSSLPSLLGELSAGAGGGGGLLGGVLGGGLISLGTTLAGLFTGGPSTPPALPVYKPPPSLAVEVASAPAYPGEAAGSSGGPRVASPAQGQGTQVTVNINAMDSQSFLDRSSDIARAVREAMLHMDPVNDLINEL